MTGSFTCPRCGTVSHHPGDVASRFCAPCGLFAGDPAGPWCPLCRRPPVWLLGGGRQAFCGTDDCKILIWDPARTLEETLTDVSFIDLLDLAPPGNGAERDGDGRSGPGDALA